MSGRCGGIEAESCSLRPQPARFFSLVDSSSQAVRP
jgi:hypothetical protein